MKLVQIAKSWYNFAEGSAATKEMMHARLEVCDRCEKKEQISEMGQLVIGILNKEHSTYRCGVCRCPLAGKTAHPSNTCPLDKWKEWITPETYY